ncbi:MAG: TolC family protein [Bacteroidales bacterium]
MIQKKKTIFILFVYLPAIFFAISGKLLSAQDIPEEEPELLEVPSLEKLISFALENSPLMGSTDIDTEVLRQKLIITRKEWMDNIRFDGAVNYGMYDQLLVRGVSDPDVDPLSQLSRGEQIRYYGGVSLRIPLSAFASRKNEIQQQKLEMEKSEMLSREQEQQIRKMVIEAYYELKYLEESVKTHHEIYQTLQISFMKAEKDMQQGRIKLNEFAGIVATLGKAKDEYLQVRNQYFLQYRLIGEITGLKELKP